MVTVTKTHVLALACGLGLASLSACGDEHAKPPATPAETLNERTRQAPTSIPPAENTTGLQDRYSRALIPLVAAIDRPSLDGTLVPDCDAIGNCTLTFQPPPTAAGEARPVRCEARARLTQASGGWVAERGDFACGKPPPDVAPSDELPVSAETAQPAN